MGDAERREAGTARELTASDRAALRALTRGGSAGTMAHELAAGLGTSQAAARARMSRLAGWAPPLIEAGRAHGFAFYKLTPAGVSVNRGRRG